MKYFKLTTQGVAVIVLLFVSCNGFKKETSEKNKTSVTELQLKQAEVNKTNFNDIAIMPGAATADSAAVAEPEPPKPFPQKTNNPVSKIDWDKKIIKTANLKLELKNYKAYNDQIRKNVKTFGGYIAQEEQTQTDDRMENVVTIKVPVGQFEEAMNVLPGTNAKIIERKISSEDVTNEYVDIKSRLASRKQVLNKYIEFLKQAKNMDEVLQVQNEINEIQENIESAAGRSEYLSHSAAFSTINLTYYQLINGVTSSDNSSSFFYKLKDAFKKGLNWIGDVTIAFASVWPLGLLALCVLLVYKRMKSPKVKAG